MAAKSYDKFEGIFNRGQHMLTSSVAAFKLLKDPKDPRAPINYNDSKVVSDMARSSIVIAVGAMDIYFTDRFCESLIPYIKNTNQIKD